MPIKPIHDPSSGPLRTVALMSGSGTNLRRILEHRQRIFLKEGKNLFEVAVIFSDAWDSKAAEIGRDFEVPVLIRDLKAWLARHGVERKDLARREEFDRENVAMLKPFGARVAIYAGYMAIASRTLIDAFLGINIHPADLSVIGPDGKRRWRGGRAVRDAIRAGEPTIRSSSHLVTLEIDAGPLLMISAPLEVEVPNVADLADDQTLKAVADRNQDRLKQAGDWVIFPRTLEAVARGDFQTDESGNLYYQGRPAPLGVKL